MEDVSNTLAKRSQQPGDLEKEFPNDAKRSKSQEDPAISIEDARKEELRSDAQIVRTMEWDTSGCAHKLVSKWEAGEGGQEELRNLRQKLEDFIKIIDDKQRRMQEHLKKVDEVQKQDKDLSNEENQPVQEPAANNDIPAEKITLANSDTGRELTDTIHEDVVLDMSAKKPEIPCLDKKVVASSSSQKNGKNKKNEDTRNATETAAVDSEHQTEQPEDLRLATKIITEPETSSAQEVHTDNRRCYKCREGMRLYGQTVFQCMGYACEVKIIANQYYYHYEKGALPVKVCETCYESRKTCNKRMDKFVLKQNDRQPVPFYECRCGRVAHKYCTHPEDNVATFQCDHCTKEVKALPSTADLPKNELTKNLEEELLRRMRRFDENVMFTVSQQCYKENMYMNIDQLPAKIKENFTTVKKVKYAVRTISVSQKIEDVDCCIVQWIIHETTSADKNGRKWTFPQYLDSLRVFEESDDGNGKPVKDPRNKGGVVAAIILEEYFNFMKSFGYTKGFLLAQVPKPGTEYLFFMRPSWQEKVQLTQENLLGWYNRTFGEMKKNGSIIGYEVLPSSNVPSTNDSPTSVDQTRANKEPNNYLIQITEDGGNRQMNGTDIFSPMSVEIASSQDAFYDNLFDHSLEFSSLRWIRYSTAVLTLNVKNAVADDKKKREASILKKMKENAKKAAKKSKRSKVQESQRAENQLE